MRLEVGEFYLNATGEILKIDCIRPFVNVFYDKNDNEYKENWKSFQGIDLIAHIPKHLHKHILNEINSYYTDKDFKETVKSVWGDKWR